MTVNELIESLELLSPEQKELPLLVGFWSGSCWEYFPRVLPSDTSRPWEWEFESIGGRAILLESHR